MRFRLEGRRGQPSDDEETQAQLAGIGYRHSVGPRGDRSKEDARKRGRQSPARVEALVLAFARVAPRPQTYSLSQCVTISRY